MAKHEQIEGEVREAGKDSVQVKSREVWAVWGARAGAEWSCWDRTRDKATAENTRRRLQRQGNAVRIVHYLLPALTIEAKEAE